MQASARKGRRSMAMPAAAVMAAAAMALGGVVSQFAGQQGQHGHVGDTGITRKKADIRRGNGGLRTIADIAADQCVNAV